MNAPIEPFDESVEAQLSRLRPTFAVDGLRQATLTQVQRELRASRCDRRLGRAAIVLLAAGIALNVATIERPSSRRHEMPVAVVATEESATKSIAEMAVSMAEVTDLQTANVFARHLAAINGISLNAEQTKAIELEIHRLLSSEASLGKRG